VPLDLGQEKPKIKFLYAFFSRFYFAVKKKAVPLHPLSGNKTPGGIKEAIFERLEINRQK